jgi:hypothetical protein
MSARLLKRLACERALALPLALMVMTASGVMVVGVIEFTSSSGRTATVAKGRMSAESLAEAGLANAFSVLNNPSNNPTTPTLLGCNAAGTTCTPVVTTYQGGTATWSGWLDTTGGTSKWRITSIGQVANPTGAAALNVKLTATVALVAGSGSPNASVWNYVYSTRPPGSGCEVELNGNNIVVSVPVYVTGDLCFNSNNAVIDERGENQNPPPQAIDVRVGGKAVFAANGTSIGLASDNVTSAAVAGGCSTSIGAAGTACNTSTWNTTRYFVDSTTTFQSLAAPTADFAANFNSASPGPFNPCTTASNPAHLPASTFDTDGVQDGNDGTFNLTPATSYQCKTYSGGSLVGELSWNASTRVLTVKGSIFIDKDVTSGSTTATYQGSATLYVGGKFTFTGNDTQLCANPGCDFTTWNPNAEMLLIVAKGASGDPDALLFNGNNGKFQGGVFCNPTSRLNLNGNNVELQGPVICGTFLFQNNALLKPLPSVTQLPIGAPVDPNVTLVPGPPVYGG